MTELTQRLCKTEVSLQANIHDYLSLRAHTLQSTRHMQEQLVAANTTRDDALLKLAEMQVPPRARTLPLPWFTVALQRKGEADIKATVQNVSSRDEVKLFEYRRQVGFPRSAVWLAAAAPTRARRRRTKRAWSWRRARASWRVCLTSLWERKRQEMSSQLS